MPRGMGTVVRVRLYLHFCVVVFESFLFVHII